MIYRAVKDPKAFDFPAAKTNRPPGNVPYLVDNIWEWLRPADMPSRRKSAYASPSPYLAAKSANLTEEDAFLVELLERQPIAQLVDFEKRSDARHHPDIGIIRRVVQHNILPNGWFDLSMSERGILGNLFLPCLEKEEVEACLEGIDVTPLKMASTFWKNVKLVEDATHVDEVGEIFFEGAYRLVTGAKMGGLPPEVV